MGFKLEALSANVATSPLPLHRRLPCRRPRVIAFGSPASGKRLTLRQNIFIRRQIAAANTACLRGCLRKMRVLACVSGSLAAMLLAGCSYGPDGGRIGEAGQVQVLTSSDLPEPTATDRFQEVRTYLIGPNDVLVVDIAGLQEMTAREIVVDGAGRIAVPLAGSIVAAGNTPDQLGSIIQDELRANFMRDPLVTVNVKNAVSQYLTIDGQVASPGNYPVLGNMTLTRAIASAKGLGEFASQDDVVVLRTVNGQRYAGVYNVAAIRRGNYPDPEVYANDVVIVGDSPRLRRMKDFLTALPAITSPLIYLLNGNN